MPAADDDTLLPFSLPSICKKKVTAAFDGGLISSDGGVLLLAGADGQLGLIDALAAIIPDHRNPDLITHSMADILRARVFAIACGYPDADDLDDLRKGPRVQTGLWATTGKRRRPGLATDDVTLGECTRPAHVDPIDARHGGPVVQKLPPRAQACPCEGGGRSRSISTTLPTRCMVINSCRCSMRTMTKDASCRSISMTRTPVIAC